MMSIRKIEVLLEEHFATHGWEATVTWKSSGSKTVLIEVWRVRSRWSPSCTIYIGFEDWDVYDCVGVSTVKPVPREQNDWLEIVVLETRWEQQLKELLAAIEAVRKGIGRSTSSPLTDPGRQA